MGLYSLHIDRTVEEIRTIRADNKYTEDSEDEDKAR